MTTITYRHTFKKELTDNERVELLDHIRSSILNKVKADIYLTEDVLNFSVPFWTGSWNLFATVDKGECGFDDNNVLFYQIKSARTVIAGLSFAVTLAVTSRQIVPSLILFSLLLVFNWLTTKLRHQTFFKDIIYYADSRIDMRTTGQ